MADVLRGNVTIPKVVGWSKDYNTMENKPTLNGVELTGNLSFDDIGLSEYIDEYNNTFSGTTEYWERNGRKISQRDAFYIYTDYTKISDGSGGWINVPGIKIGDGGAYIVDLPFISSEKQILEHMANHSIHVSDNDRTNWDDKVSANIEGETLIFS